MLSNELLAVVCVGNIRSTAIITMNTDLYFEIIGSHELIIQSFGQYRPRRILWKHI
jgi:hypothetical protein